MRIKIKVLLLITSFLLMGCTTDEARIEVETYNRLVEDTLVSFELSKQFALANQDHVIPFIYYNALSPLIESMSPTPDYLSVEDINTFRGGSILYNDFYLALGAVSVTQHLIIKGRGNNIMIVELVWNRDSLVSFTREVKLYK